MEAAYDAVEAAQATAEPAAATPEPAATTEAATPAESPEGRARDEKGRFAPGAAKGESSPPPPAAKTQEGVAAPAVAIGTPPAPVVEVRAPQSWKPDVRELVSRLPPEFRPILDEANRRERETQLAMQRASEAQRGLEPLLRSVQPFVQGLQQRGFDPAQIVGNMLRTEQALSNPDERVRANVIAQALKQYGVGVETLAAAIDGQPRQTQQQAIDPQQIVQQAKAELLREIEQQRIQQASSAASNEIESFAPQAEFLDDVRMTAAAILQSAAEAGVAKTLKEAYEEACWADSRIRGIYQQREASKKAATGAQATQRAHAAASSVKSQPGGGNGTTPLGDSWREHLEASWDKLSQ